MARRGFRQSRWHNVPRGPRARGRRAGVGAQRVGGRPAGSSDRAPTSTRGAHSRRSLARRPRASSIRPLPRARWPASHLCRWHNVPLFAARTRGAGGGALCHFAPMTHVRQLMRPANRGTSENGPPKVLVGASSTGSCRPSPRLVPRTSHWGFAGGTLCHGEPDARAKWHAVPARVSSPARGVRRLYGVALFGGSAHAAHDEPGMAVHRWRPIHAMS